MDGTVSFTQFSEVPPEVIGKKENDLLKRNELKGLLILLKVK